MTSATNLEIHGRAPCSSQVLVWRVWQGARIGMNRDQCLYFNRKHSSAQIAGATQERVSQGPSLAHPHPLHHPLASSTQPEYSTFSSVMHEAPGLDQEYPSQAAYTSSSFAQHAGFWHLLSQNSLNQLRLSFVCDVTWQSARETATPATAGCYLGVPEIGLLYLIIHL